MIDNDGRIVTQHQDIIDLVEEMGAAGIFAKIGKEEYFIVDINQACLQKSQNVTCRVKAGCSTVPVPFLQNRIQDRQHSCDVSSKSRVQENLWRGPHSIQQMPYTTFLGLPNCEGCAYTIISCII